MSTIDKIKLSGTTYDIVDSTAIHSMDGYWTSGQTEDAITAATGALAETIAEELSGKVDSDTYTAYTAATDTVLEGKADVSDIPSVSGYADSVKYNSTSKYVEFYHGGTGGTKVFEYDASPFLIDGMVQNVEIKNIESASTTTYNRYWPAQNEPTTYENGITSLSIAGWVSNVEDNTLRIEIINETGETVSGASSYDKSYFTGQNFIPTNLRGYISGNVTSQAAGEADIVVTADGWKVNYVDNDTYASNGVVIVPSTITVTCLVISFNTDAGKQDINIPISEIFDASNYYTKTETDNAISAATSGKADTSAVTAVNDALTAHTSNNEIHVTTSDKSTWSGKQDALVSGTNIKTINNQSILGSGNIDVQTLPTVTGTTLVFS